VVTGKATCTMGVVTLTLQFVNFVTKKRKEKKRKEKKRTEDNMCKEH